MDSNSPEPSPSAESICLAVVTALTFPEEVHSARLLVLLMAVATPDPAAEASV